MECKKCASNNYTIINSRKIRHDRYQKIIIQLRQCNNCYHRYRIAINGRQEFYFH